MAKKTESARGAGPMVGYGLVLVSLLIAVADSVYLLINHISHKRGAALASFCDISVDVNCRGAIESSWSTLIGVPVPVWAVAFYATMLLGALRLGAPRATPPREGWAIIAAGYVFATAYSLFLLYLLLFEIRILCPGCLVLDVANIMGLVGAFLVVGLPVGAGVRWVVSRLRRVALGGAGMAFLLGFAALFLIAALVTRGQLTVPGQDRPIPPDQAYNIVEGFPDDFVRVEVADSDGAPVKGSPDAPVVLVEFSDFECPYCQRFAGVLTELVTQNPDMVQVRFMSYPLNNACNPNVSSQGHTEACGAARAAVCAQDQNRFWELHDLLFANNQHLGRDSILDMATGLGLDLDEFQACWDSDYSLERVRAQTVAGHDAVQAAGFDRAGTPFSFVNGLFVRGARPLNELEALVRREAAGDGEGTGEAAAVPVAP